MENITLKNLFSKNIIIVLLKLFFPGILFLFLLIAFSFKLHVDFGMLSRDVNGIFNAPPYVGMLSNFGIFLWSLTAAVVLFTYKLSIAFDQNKRQSHFLLFAGLLTVLMFIDDLFMLHEYIFPIYLHLPDSLFYFVYGLSVILIFYFYFDLVNNSDYVLFIGAFMLFGLSGFCSEAWDYFGIRVPYQHILEDGTKFLGILSWFFYFTRLSYQYLSLLLKTRNSKVEPL